MDVTKTGNGQWGMGNGQWVMGNGKLKNGKMEKLKIAKCTLKKEIEVFAEVSKICFFLNVIFIAHRIISFQLWPVLPKCATYIFFFLYK